MQEISFIFKRPFFNRYFFILWLVNYPKPVISGSKSSGYLDTRPPRFKALYVVSEKMRFVHSIPLLLRLRKKKRENTKHH